MRIGLDIDNVILDTDKYLLKAFKKEDKNKRNKGIINKDADYIFCEMFDWSKEEIQDFLERSMEDIAINLKPLKNARKYINRLLKNNEVFLISNRAYPQYKDAYKTTIDNLAKNKINYTKLILTKTNDKTRACLENKIDIMVDDRVSNLMILLDRDIKCLLMKSRYEKRNFNNLNVVNNWKELYIRLKKEGA